MGVFKCENTKSKEMTKEMMSKFQKETIQHSSIQKNMLNDVRACQIKDDANSELNWMIKLEWVKCLCSSFVRCNQIQTMLTSAINIRGLNCL